MPAPKIDDQFWFDYSAQLVLQAETSRREAAEKLRTNVLWLWGIFTGGSALGYGIKGHPPSIASGLLFALGGALLIVAYWICVYIQVPVKGGFDPRSPTDIRNCYNETIKTLDWRLNLALAMLFIATSCYALGYFANL